MDSSKKMVHLSGLEMGWIRLTCISDIIFFILFFKMYLPLGKSYSKLLGVKCITLNLPPISRKCSAQ